MKIRDIKKIKYCIQTIFGLSFLILSFTNCQSAKAETVTKTHQSRVDTYVDSSNPTTSYSSVGTMSMGYNTITQTKKRAFIDMNAYLPASAVLQSATLKFWVTSCFGTEKISVGQINSIFSDASYVTWNNQPTWGTVLHKTAVCSSNNWLNIDVKEIAETWNDPHPSYGFALFGTESGISWGRTVSSRDGQYQPLVELTYEYTPILPTVSNLLVSNITKTSTDLDWATSTDNTTIIQLNTTPTQTDNWIVPAEDFTRTHHIDLDSLSPGQKYYFAIFDYESVVGRTFNISGWQEFTTATDSVAGSSSIGSVGTTSSSVAMQSAPKAKNSNTAPVSEATEEVPLTENFVSYIKDATNKDPERWPWTLNMLERRLLVGGCLLIIIGLPISIYLIVRAIFRRKKSPALASSSPSSVTQPPSTTSSSPKLPPPPQPPKTE